jgi:DNA-binding NarL/FixJ family response regulator
VEEKSFDELMEKAEREENDFIFADRFFFGIHFEKQLQKLFKTLPEIQVAVVMYGACDKYLGFRYHLNSVDSVITAMEDSRHLYTAVTNIINFGKQTFPDNVREGIRLREHITERQLCRELTEKEDFILKRMAEGKTMKEIGSEMKCTSSTVAAHMFRARKKIGALNNIDAIRICLTAGLIQTKEGVGYDCKS